MIGRLFGNILQKSVSNATTVASSNSLIPSSFNLFWNATTIRTKVRYYFPRPNEKQRIRKFGWETRMKTLSGRKVIWNRILKGKTFLTH